MELDLHLFRSLSHFVRFHAEVGLIGTIRTGGARSIPFLLQAVPTVHGEVRALGFLIFLRTDGAGPASLQESVSLRLISG